MLKVIRRAKEARTQTATNLLRAESVYYVQYEIVKYLAPAHGRMLNTLTN